MKKHLPFFTATLILIVFTCFSPVHGQWNKYFIEEDLPSATHVFIADIDGDSDLDLAATSYSIDYVVWYENAGDNQTWTRHIIDNDLDDTHGVKVADINGDGHSDVVSAGYKSDNVVWYENDGRIPIGWTKHSIDNNLDKASWVNVADVDGDLDLDVIASPYSEDNIVWYENKGGTPVEWTRYHVGGTGRSNVHAGAGLRIADMDSDNDPDIVHATNNKVFWYENGGGMPVNWTRHMIDINVESNRNGRVGDLDGDSDPDVVITTGDANKVIWYENGGDALIWTEHIIDTDLNVAAGLDLTDIDGDTDLDIVAAGYEADEVVWYENNLPETNWTKRTIDSLRVAPANVQTADFDGDGDPEVVVAGQIDNDIVWYENLVITDLDSELTELPDKFTLNQNFPNPFNPTTTIKYSIPVSSLQSSVGSQKQKKSQSTNHSINQSNGGLVSLKIYDVLGKEVAVLVNEHQRPGHYEVQWDAAGMPSGVYFYKLTAGTHTECRKMILMK